MAKKGNRVQVILECTEHKNSGKPGTSRYITVKNREKQPGKIGVEEVQRDPEENDLAQRDQIS